MCFWTLQKILEDSSIKLAASIELLQNPTEMDSVVNECQNYLSVLRNLAIEVKSLLFLMIPIASTLSLPCAFCCLSLVSALTMNFRTHVFLCFESWSFMLLVNMNTRAQ